MFTLLHPPTLAWLWRWAPARHWQLPWPTLPFPLPAFRGVQFPPAFPCSASCRWRCALRFPTTTRPPAHVASRQLRREAASKSPQTNRVWASKLRRPQRWWRALGVIWPNWAFQALVSKWDSAKSRRRVRSTLRTATHTACTPESPENAHRILESSTHATGRAQTQELPQRKHDIAKTCSAQSRSESTLAKHPIQKLLKFGFFSG